MAMIKAGVVQDSPVFFDKEKTLDKVEALVEECSAMGCQLVLFPESFIPGYPRGLSFGTRVGERSPKGRKMYEEYYKNSLDLNSRDLDRLQVVSKNFGIYLVIGVTEKRRENGSLYCSMLYISPNEGLMGVHRKIKPTGFERVIWGESDGSDLVTFDTDIGRMGGLICWENYMPLARAAMFQKGIEIYLAPTADSRESWVASMRHIALEGRCFVLGCNQYFTKSMYTAEYQAEMNDLQEEICPGGSLIVSPLGEIISGPLFGKTGIITADLNMDEVVQSKLDFDANGHYTRPDIFELRVSNQPDIYIESNKTRQSNE